MCKNAAEHDKLLLHGLLSLLKCVSIYNDSLFQTATAGLRLMFLTYGLFIYLKINKQSFIYSCLCVCDFLITTSIVRLFCW